MLVVRSSDPGRHWFAPPEVVLAVEIESPGSHVQDRIVADEPFAVDVALADLLPGWAR